MKTYPSKSWIHPGLRTGSSSIAGNGLFTDVKLVVGEAVVIMGGILLTQTDIESGKFKQHSIIGIDENLWLGDSPDAVDDSLDNYINHSCDPTLWMGDEITLITRRTIEPGEELTMDYSMWIPDLSWKMRVQCSCGNTCCRGTIRGSDWNLQELQDRYKGHFSPFINRRIEGCNNRIS